jgi:phosphoenolpyruvate synthase/pyruvate phosphate dikinase
MIIEIKSFLQPEIQYATRFTMLRSIQSRYSGLWEVEYNLMGKVPKKLIMDLVEKCKIYPSMYVKSKDQKEKWCRMIIEETNKFDYQKSITRMDKLLALNNEEWSSDPNEKRIDKWYKFYLYIFVYKKYRAELEADIKNKTEKLTILKNKKFVVK